MRGADVIKQILGLAFILVVTAILRYWIFDLDAPKPTAQLYDKPVRLEQLVIPADKVPQGWKPMDVPQGEPASSPGQGRRASPARKLARAELLVAVPAFGQLTLPSPDDAIEYQLVIYSTDLGEKVHLVSVRYKGRQTLKSLDQTRYGAPNFQVQDDVLTWIGADTAAVAEKFHGPFNAEAQVQKRRRVGVEKMSVAGTAVLKTCMDLLVGAFAFALFLFLTKYFLIIRSVEG